jgi:hypothetical protein
LLQGNITRVSSHEIGGSANNAFSATASSNRSGMIRSTSGVRGGDPKLEGENSLRNLINNLLEEKLPAPTGNSGSGPAAL